MKKKQGIFTKAKSKEKLVKQADARDAWMTHYKKWGIDLEHNMSLDWLQILFVHTFLKACLYLDLRKAVEIWNLIENMTNHMEKFQ